jgi:hypothetical protein
MNPLFGFSAIPCPIVVGLKKLQTNYTGSREAREYVD